MKRLLSIAILSAASAAAMLPLSAAAQTRVYVSMHDQVPQHAYGHDRYERVQHHQQYHDGYTYAPSARMRRDDRYVEPRYFIDRNRDGMDDRRGRRDLDRDGILDTYDRDLDNDGIKNQYDRDMDGDGVSNRRDRRPDNPYAY